MRAIGAGCFEIHGRVTVPDARWITPQAGAARKTVKGNVRKN
jgi:hypothetical protein